MGSVAFLFSALHVTEAVPIIGVALFLLRLASTSTEFDGHNDDDEGGDEGDEADDHDDDEDDDDDDDEHLHT